MYVNWSAGALTGEVCPPLVTVTSTGPSPVVEAGATAVMLVLEFTVKLVAGLDPKLTCSPPALVKPEPVICTVWPPVSAPLSLPLRVEVPVTEGGIVREASATGAATGGTTFPLLPVVG